MSPNFYFIFKLLILENISSNQSYWTNSKKKIKIVHVLDDLVRLDCHLIFYFVTNKPPTFLFGLNTDQLKIVETIKF